MKKLFILLIIAASTFPVFAQPPQKMSYQCVLRDKDGGLLKKQVVGMRTTILQGSDIQLVVYQETYNFTATNANGLLSIEIGSGKPTIASGSFSSIPWASGPFFLKTEIDPAGGTNYSIVGQSQLLSVPYALYSEKTGSMNETDPLWSAVSANYYTKNNLQTRGGADVLFSNLTGKPTSLAGYGITDAFNGSWTSLTEKPTFATVATSGSYNDLINKPTGNNRGDMQYWDGTSWVMVPVGQPGQFLQLSADNIPVWSGAVYPSVTTAALSSLTGNSVTSGGNVTSDGGEAVTARGVCWSTVPNPTIASNKTLNGTGKGTFTSYITGLTAQITYYVRAYATNSLGTGYGNEISFTTPPVILPTVLTREIISIASTHASSGGAITSDGGGTVTARGVCWSTSANPTIANNKTADDDTGAGCFTSSITGLSLGNTYYVRAYATNIAGTAYGDEISFTTVIAIGDSYQGGIIAYFLKPEDPGYIAGQKHGLIAAQYNQSTGIQWHNGIYITIGTTATALGTGHANTITIVTIQEAGNYAAKLCNDLISGGYSDWFLPSRDELNKLYIHRYEIGGFAEECYWSSSEYNNSSSHILDFWNGLQGISNKGSDYHVRAIRTF